MLNYILVGTQIAILLVIAVLLFQFCRCWRSILKDEVIGEERTTYMTRRLTWLGICAVAEAALQIVSILVRLVD